MSVVKGDLKILYIKEGLTYLPIGCLTSHGFSESVETLDTTTRDNNGWNTSKPTNQSYSISFDGVLTQELLSTTKVTFGQIKQLKRSRTLIEWKIEDDNGNIDYGSGFFTDLSETASLNEFVTFNGTIIGYGKPVDPILEVYDAYENRVITGGGEITSESCQLEFLRELLKI